MVLRAPPLLDEVVAQMGMGGREALWVPRSGVVEITDGDRLSAKVLRAIDGEQDGSTLRASGEILDAPTLFARAVNLFAASGVAPRLHIHGVWPPLYRFTRSLLRLLGRPEPAALTLWDKLGQRALPSAREAAPA